MLDLLEEYHNNGWDERRYAYIEGLSVLDAYMSFTDNDTEPLKVRYKALVLDAGKSHSGFDVVDMDTIYDRLDLEQNQYFIQSRHSVRCYKKQSVNVEIMQKVIKLASRAPSACNRQPVKVYVTTDPERVKEVSMLIPGNKGFEDEIPNWAVVTADRKMFGTSEPFQWYVNGGIYLSYLVQSFHAYHIASCIFQIPASHPDTPKLRSLAGVQENEAIIAAVGFGYPKKETKVLAAERRPVSEILVKF